MDTQMKKYVLSFILLALSTQTAIADSTTFAVTVPSCIHPTFSQSFDNQTIKPEWKKFLQTYAISTAAAVSIGAVTGIGSAAVQKHWVIQNGRSSDFRWFVNFIGSAIVHWNLVNLINTGLQESRIPHDPAFISIGSWIADWGFYLYSRRS